MCSYFVYFKALFVLYQGAAQEEREAAEGGRVAKLFQGPSCEKRPDTCNMWVHLSVWCEDERLRPYLFIQCKVPDKMGAENPAPPFSAHIRDCEWSKQLLLLVSVAQLPFTHRSYSLIHPASWPAITKHTRGCIPEVIQQLETHLWILTNANAPVASMKDSGVLAGRGGGESSLSQQSGLKRSEVKWEAMLTTGEISDCILSSTMTLY